MQKVVWADLCDYGPPATEDQEALAAVTDPHYYYDRPDVDAFLERCQGATAIVSDVMEITKEMIDRLVGLEMISVIGVGANQIDRSYARSVGITLCNTPHYGDSTVAEYALGLMLAASRQIVRADRSMREGRWEAFPGKDMRGSTMGIVGLGGVGSHLAAFGNALGMEVICYTRRPTPERARRHSVRFVGLEELMSSSDFLQLTTELNDETIGLIGRAQLERMKPGAYLINVARAGLVDQAALLDLLKQGGIAGYATDIYETEPAIDHPLTRLDNVIVTPHTAWNTPGSSMAQLRIATANVLTFLDGRPQNVIGW
jgi:D-3-phosphoglycerate dehydrogenase